VNIFAAESRASRIAVAKQPGERPVVRETRLQDFDQIAGLQRRYGLAVKPREDWLALWADNPVYKAQAGRWPLGWVLEAEGGRIVGSIGNIPLSYRLNGRELLAATACSWVVEPQYRGYSMLIYFRFLRQADVDLSVCTTVSASAEPVLRGFHFSRVPVGDWQRSGFWITGYGGLIRTALRRKSVPLTSVFSFPISALLSFRNKPRPSALRFNGSSPEIELCAGFDNRFDEFWEELAFMNRRILLAVRNRETLSWHFRASSRRKVHIMTACRGSRLIGYAIFDRADNVELGLNRVRLIDFQAVHNPEILLPLVIQQMLRTCREENIHALEITGQWLDRFSESPIVPPYRRTLPSWTYYYKANGSELSVALRAPAVWAPSTFDGDASL
jgi:hypothetical protein